MTLSPSIEQVLPPALDHPSDPSSRRTARIAGIFTVIKPSPILYDDGRRAGVDGPLIPAVVA